MIRSLAILSVLQSMLLPCYAQTEPPQSEPPTTPPHPRPSAQAPLAAYPLPIVHPHQWRYTIAAPSPAFFQSRQGNRPKRTQLQLPFAFYGGLGEKKGWGQLFVASENVLSTDAFDNSARFGLRFGVEHALFPTGPLLTSEVGVVANQRGQNQALGASIGTRFLLPLRMGAGFPDIQVNFLGYENRRRLNEEASPFHTGRDVLNSSLSVSLPPLCFGKSDPRFRPYLQLRARSWYFYNESAMAGQMPHDFEMRYETAFILPARSVRKKTAFVKAVSFSYIWGANDANAYAFQRNFRINFILVDTRRLLDELTEHRILPKVPDIKLSPPLKPEEKPTEPGNSKEAAPVTSSTESEPTGKPPRVQQN